MTATAPISEEEIRQQARQWLTHLYSGKTTDADRTRFEQWLIAAPGNAPAYRRAEQLWRDLQWAPELAQIPIEAPSFAQRSRAWFESLFSWPAVAVTTGTAAVAAILALGPSQLRDLFDPRIDAYTTAIAEVRELSLKDGSHVALGARSRIRTDFSTTQRRISLESGEALFTVAKDPTRPFYVAVGDTLVRAVGTRFDVRHGAEEVRIAVREGAVEVTRAQRGSWAPASARVEDRRLLKAGQEIVAALKGGTLTTVRDMEPAHMGSWREGRLSYENATLAEVIVDANRYSEQRIEFGADELREVRVTTAFRTDQIADMLAGLAATHPIAVDRSHAGRIILRPREPR